MSTYSQSSEGTFIPATKRPDGTWRKARKVKEGYVPQDEVPLYESKGKKFAKRETELPPGMCPIIAEAEKKKREKQERAKMRKANAANEVKQSIPGLIMLPTSQLNPKDSLQCKNTLNTNNVKEVTERLETSLIINSKEQIDVAKQLKKFKKKIREIEAIEEKIYSGESKKLDKDQLDKVKRKQNILKEIEKLEKAIKLVQE